MATDFFWLYRSTIVKSTVTDGNLVVWDGDMDDLKAGPRGVRDGGAPSPGGITELTGPVTAGPGSGSQVTTITPTGVTAATYGSTSTIPVITVNVAGQITAASEVSISTVDYVPLALGTEPLAFVSDGAGSPILVPFTP